MAGGVCTRTGGTTAGVKGREGVGGKGGACRTGDGALTFFARFLGGGEAREGCQVDEDIRR